MIDDVVLVHSFQCSGCNGEADQLDRARGRLYCSEPCLESEAVCDEAAAVKLVRFADGRTVALVGRRRASSGRSRQRRKPNTQSRTAEAKRRAEEAKRQGKSKADEAKRRAEEAKRKGQSKADDAKSKAEDAKDKAKSKAEEAKDIPPNITPPQTAPPEITPPPTVPPEIAPPETAPSDVPPPEVQPDSEPSETSMVELIKKRFGKQMPMSDAVEWLINEPYGLSEGEILLVQRAQSVLIHYKNWKF